VAFFDRRAEIYDRQLPLERQALETAASLAEPLAGARVVDLAAGTGALSAALVARAPSIPALTLVDASPRMLALAGRRLSGHVGRTSFLLADVRRTPLADGCADVVGIGYLLHLLDPEPRGAVLGEALRILRPGGTLVVVVHGSPGGVGGRLYRGAWRAIGRLMPRSVLGAPMTGLAEAVAAAGFHVESSRRLRGVYWSEVLRARRPGGDAQR
jgi:ubiquinone/menaquinone biosynthesis C-methylase UbiE